MEKLDEKDRKLLQALKVNSRASLVSLGRDIGLSRSATHDRITRLEERGIIKSYTVEIDTDHMPKTRAFISIQFKPEFANSVVTKDIFSKPGIVSTYCLTGDIDTLAYCECASMSELSTLRDEIARLPGVLEIHIRNVLISHG